jgi:hypothetical protein
VKDVQVYLVDDDDLDLSTEWVNGTVRQGRSRSDTC